MFKFELLSKIVSNTEEFTFKEGLNNLNKLSINEQFELLNKPKIILEHGCSLLNPNSAKFKNKFMSCLNYSRVKSTINLNQYCFTLFFQSKGEPDSKFSINYDQLFSGGRRDEVLIYLLFSDFIKLISLYMHSRNTALRYEVETKNLKLYHSSVETIYIKYRKTIVQLMPKPYSTSCVDYTKVGYSSRSDCIFKCKTDIYMNELNSWPGSYFTEDSESNFLMTEENNQTINSMLGEKCDKICGLEIDCLREYFTFEDQATPALLNKHLEIIVTPPSHPTLLITHSAKIEFEEFLCYVTSIIGLWFGFSVIMLFDVFKIIIKFTTKFVNDYKAKISIITNCDVINNWSKIIKN
jgi:hypothetical protein